MKPDSPTRPEAADKVIRRQAAEWLALREARPFQAHEQAAFTAWCATDPRHNEIFSEMEAAYRTFDQLAFYPRPMDGRIDSDLLVGTRRRGGARKLATWAAIAAAIAVIAGFSWERSESAERHLLAVAASPRFLRLSDGSRVELNSGSEVAEHFTATERRIRLIRGEAHFDVAKNPQRPFIVEADTVAVRAVGTAFDVRIGATAVDVLVTEGKVGIAPTAQSNAPGITGLGTGLLLVAGQRTTVPTLPAPSTPLVPVIEDLSQHQIDRALSWQSSRLVFDAMPLAEIADRFNRASEERDGPDALQLKISDAGLAALRISGRIRSDSVENFVQVLQDDFGVKVERNGREIRLRRD